MQAKLDNFKSIEGLSRINGSEPFFLDTPPQTSSSRRGAGDVETETDVHSHMLDKLREEFKIDEVNNKGQLFYNHAPPDHEF